MWGHRGASALLGALLAAAFVLVVPFATKVEGRRRNGRGRASAALAIVGLSLTLAAPVGVKAATLAPTGATFTVTSTADAVDANLGDGVCSAASGACTLRAAIQQANALAGADTIQVPAGTYVLAIHGQNQNLAESGDLDVTGPLTIAGAGATSTIVDGGTPASAASEIRGLDRLFEIHPGAGDVSLVDLTVQEGYSAEQGGAIYHASAGTLHLERVQVLDSYAAKYGGGIANASTGQVELVDSIVSGNGAKEGGSAITNVVSGTVSVTAGSAIVDNPGTSADNYPITGGAINNEGEGDTIGTIEIVDSTVARQRGIEQRRGHLQRARRPRRRPALHRHGQQDVVQRSRDLQQQRHHPRPREHDLGQRRRESHQHR